MLHSPRTRNTVRLEENDEKQFLDLTTLVAVTESRSTARLDGIEVHK